MEVAHLSVCSLMSHHLSIPLIVILFGLATWVQSERHCVAMVCSFSSVVISSCWEGVALPPPVEDLYETVG